MIKFDEFFPANLLEENTIEQTSKDLPTTASDTKKSYRETFFDNLQALLDYLLKANHIDKEVAIADINELSDSVPEIRELKEILNDLSDTTLSDEENLPIEDLNKLKAAAYKIKEYFKNTNTKVLPELLKRF